MKANGKPQISRALQGQTEKQSNDSGSERTHFILTLISQMDSPEGEGENQRCGPEPKAAAQSELRISAQKKLFEQSNNYKKYQPEHRELQNAKSAQGKTPEMKHSGNTHCDHQHRKRNDAP